MTAIRTAASIALILAVAGLPASTLAQPAPAAAKAAGATESLPIRRITLYRSGVGSFDRRGLVDANATIQLKFDASQINDILKSMVVLDLSKGEGRIDGISYSSKEPLSRKLASFGIDIADNPAAGELLNRLRGTSVRLTTGEGTVSGTILNVEKRPTVFTASQGGSPAVFDLPWANLVTDSGVKSVNLTSVTGFEILDKELAAELNKALAALSEYRADRTKTVDIHLSGASSREIVVAYVQEAPVWKTSYRLVLPDMKPDDANLKAPADSFTIQGWAIVENTTDEDWRDVTLSLVAGRPVSFRMDLYEPLYVFRPEIPVPSIPGVAPRTFAGGDGAVLMEMAEPAAPGAPVVSGRSAERGAPRDKAGAPGTAGGKSPFRENNSAFRESYSSDSLIAADMASYGASAQSRAVESGEVFQFELEHPVTVERQRSAMLPIISAGITGRRVSIFNLADGSEHPMRGAEITNTSKMQLMPGPISVFDGGTYAGDSQIGHVPEGDNRLLAYSVDLETKVAVESSGDEAIRRVRIVNGLMEVTVLRRTTSTYKATNKDQKRTRTLIIEHNKINGWTLPEDLKPSEQTDNVYRFELAIEPGKQATKAVTLERVEASSWELASFNSVTLMSYAKSGKTSDKVVEAFREAGRRQGLINAANQRIADIDKQTQEISSEQSRIRENMKTIDRASDLYTRYMKKLTEQETTLETLSTDVKAARADLTQRQRELADYLSNLNVE